MTEAAGGAAAWWEGRPWRLIQTNLREIDMRDIDAARYVDDLRSFEATVAMINTSGIIASYPTRLPFHTPSAFLTGDGLETIVAACHEAGIRVIARMDFSKVRRPLYEEHPQWAYRRSDGEVVDEHGDVHVCPSGAYQQECVPEIVEETITTLGVDGVFLNMAGFQTRDYAGLYHGICHCASCAEGFEAMFGLGLPEEEDLDDPVYRRYAVFKRRTLRALDERIHETIRRIRPDIAIDRSFEDGRGFVRQESNTALDRREDWPYSASENTKWVVGSFPRMVSSNSSVDFIDYPVRHVAVSPHQQELRLVQDLASGGGLDYCVIGRLDDHADRSGFEAVRSIFRYHAVHEREYEGLRSCATTALVTGAGANAEEVRGWFRVLTEHHLLFDSLILDAITGEALERYRALVLPDHQPVSDEQARRLDDFVRRGGVLVATGRTGFRDHEFEPREPPALESQGIERVREVRPDMRGAYFQVGEGSPRLEHTDLVFLDGPYVDAEYRPDAESRMRLVPPGPFGPPERVYVETVTDDPGLVVSAFGRGRFVYMPWLPGTLVLRHGHENTVAFAADALEHHAGLEPLGGTLPPMVEATLMETSDGTASLLHLINHSGRAGNRYVEPVPIRDLEVVMPFDAEPAAVTGLVSGRAFEWWAGQGRLSIRVPELGLFEAVRIER
ncbi:MAG TPA: alpha-amylase family protein [Actinomycetota bacterium]|nr:alpha-amylase family protein [Actinomycetota bacterium]